MHSENICNASSSSLELKTAATLLSPNTCTWFSFLFYPVASQKPVLSSMNIKVLEFIFFSLILNPILTAVESSHGMFTLVLY